MPQRKISVGEIHATGGINDLVIAFKGWPEDYDRVSLLRAIRRSLKKNLGSRYKYKTFQACILERGFACSDPKGEYSFIQCDPSGWAYSRLDATGIDYHKAPSSDVVAVTYIDTRGVPFP